MTRQSWLIALASLRAVVSGLEQHELVAGYRPQSSVEDIAVIDKDLARMDALLVSGKQPAFEEARAIYVEGDHFLPVAFLSLEQGLNKTLPKGTLLTAVSLNDEKINGQIHAEAYAGDRELQFAYHINSPAENSTCQVGALSNGERELNGCLQRQGSIKVVGTGESLAYSYDPHKDNNSGPTLQRFSTDAKRLMYDCPNCPQEDFLKFHGYYGRPDYSDAWMVAAFEGTRTRFPNVNIDFDEMGLEGRGEFIAKGVSSMGVWMFVIGLMEASLDKCMSGCVDCNNGAIRLWDEAVALYTGSLEGPDGSGDGHFAYSLADERCTEFNTCGKRRNKLTGTSAVNLEIFELFRQSHEEMLSGVCQPAHDHKRRIVDLMTIPLIQSSLKYSYIVGRQPSGSSKEEAEAAVFAASLLPIIHHCSKEDAIIIWENVALDFVQVKEAFERNYECLRITCDDIGGVYDSQNLSYYPDATPCSRPYSDTGWEISHIVTLTIVSMMLAFFLLTCCCLPMRRRRIVKIGSEMPLPACNGQIECEDDGWEELTLFQHFVI